MGFTCILLTNIFLDGRYWDFKPPFGRVQFIYFNLLLVYDDYLSHNNPCFPFNIAITNFLVSHTCEIKFHDVIGQSPVHACICIPTLTYMAK